MFFGVCVLCFFCVCVCTLFIPFTSHSLTHALTHQQTQTQPNQHQKTNTPPPKKIAEDRTFADCARYILATMLSLCAPPPPWVASECAEYQELFAPPPAPDARTAAGKLALIKRFKAQLADWGSLLARFLRSEDDQVELLLTLEEYCADEGVFEGAGEAGALFGPVFAQVLQQLYDADIVGEDAFSAWAGEKEHADEEDKVWLTKAAPFLTWLAEADEDESGSGSEE